MLLPGSLTPYVRGGHTIALPFTEIPWAVRWRRDAFQAAGRSPPADDWSIVDLQTACVALKALAASGRLRGLEGALAPLVQPATLSGAFRPCALSYPGLWQAFVWGFGGIIAADGRFQLTGPGSIQGLSTLVYLAQQFCVSGANWQWARLPRFPVAPVIPTVSVAQGLLTTVRTLHSTEVAAAVDYLLWFYTPEATVLLSAEATPPALAGAAVQHAYWRRQQGAGPVGDYQHFRPAFSGFPYAFFGTMYNVIASAVSGTTPLAGALGAAQQRLNAHRPQGAIGLEMAPPQIG